MLQQQLTHLTPASTLADLPSHDFQVDPATPGQGLFAALEKHPDLPGVILRFPDGTRGLISRPSFFKQMCRLFSLEIYLKRPVLLDAMMPEIDGFMVLEEIGRRPDLGCPTIMMLSSADRQGDAGRSRALGAAGYLVKPVEEADLLEAILTLQGAAGAPRKAAGAEPAAASPKMRRLHILLAEDNPVNQQLAVRLLERQGHSVTVVADGRAALAILGERRFDLVLMDVEMGEMDGLETTAAFRAAEGPTGRRTPVIALTAHAMTGDRERCLAAGMDDYLSKPLRTRELFATIARLVPPDADEPPADDVMDAARSLEGLGDDHDLLRELTGMFLEQSPPLRGEMAEAAARRDPVQLYRSAHALKGAAAVFCAEPVTEALARLEKMGRNDDWAEIDQALPAMVHEVGRLETALTELAAAQEASTVCGEVKSL